MKLIPLKIPDFVARSKHKLEVKATLCYSFLPVKQSQLNYLPLYISFGLFQNVDANFMSQSDVSKYQIKESVSWADDFHGIENRLFSNCKQLHFNLQPHDLNNQEICIAVRCALKNEIPENIRKGYQESQHSFSLVLTLRELAREQPGGGLYASISALNEVKNIGSIATDADLEAEA